MKTFYFNTGVRMSTNSFKNPTDLWAEIKGGGDLVRVIPFDCQDVPEKAELMYLADTPNLSHTPKVIVREVFNTTLLSKYAYFKVA
jgi:hypothetical protein